MTSTLLAPVAQVALPDFGTLSDDDANLASFLTQKLFSQRPALQLTDLYYDSEQKMQDLGISIPPSLKNLRTVIGWPTIGVDAIADRCKIEGFRYPDATDTDEDLWDIWQSSGMDLEFSLAELDALIFGRSYLVVGAGGDYTNGNPLITAESPMNLTGIWDERTKQCTAAIQIYLDTDITSDTYGNECAALYLPERTLQMTRQASSPGLVTANGKWELLPSTDYHDLGYVPVVRMSNRARLKNRDGHSEIRKSWMNTVDSACRTLLGMEIGREFFSAPRRYVLGASEDAFQKADGTAVSAWETYVNKIWALERDEDDNVPTVGEFTASDPSVHTKLVQQYAQIMAGEMAVPPHELGVYSDGNPASADAIRSGYEALTKRSTSKQPSFGCAAMDALRLALLIRDGSVPPNASRMEADWMDPAPTTPAATADAIAKYVTAGVFVATSDVTLKKAGLSAAERARMAADREADQGQSLLDELAHSILAKDAKVDQTIAQDVTEPAAPGAGTPPKNPGPPLVPVLPPPAGGK